MLPTIFLFDFKVDLTRFEILVYAGLATCDRCSLKVTLCFSELAALPPLLGSSLATVPPLRLAFRSAPRSRFRWRSPSAASGVRCSRGVWLALWRHQERPSYRGPCVRLGGQHHLLLSSPFRLQFLLRISQHNRIRYNILANRLVTTVQPLSQGHI